jgi:hypothetical protein
VLIQKAAAFNKYFDLLISWKVILSALGCPRFWLRGIQNEIHPLNSAAEYMEKE